VGGFTGGKLMPSTGPLEDRIAIRELVEAYGDAVFRKDADMWGDCWADDAAWFIAGFEKRGRAEIVGLWQGLMADFDLAAFYLTAGQVHVDGASATGRWYLLELLKPGKPGPFIQFISYYDDRYGKGADGRWRMAERRYTILNQSLVETLPIPPRA
jgi:ketosteroid isomerase-like protein